MWRYVLLLAVFNIGCGISLFLTPKKEYVLNNTGHYAVLAQYGTASLFMLAGVLCLSELIYRFTRGRKKGVTVYRLVVQAASLIAALILTSAIILGVATNGIPGSAIFSWVLISIGQALMIRMGDFSQPNKKDSEKLQESLRDAVEGNE